MSVIFDPFMGYIYNQDGIFYKNPQSIDFCPTHPYTLSTVTRLIHFASFHFIRPVMVRQAWLADILAIHRPSIKGLDRITSLDQALGGTRVEDNLKKKS